MDAGWTQHKIDFAEDGLDSIEDLEVDDQHDADTGLYGEYTWNDSSDHIAMFVREFDNYQGGAQGPDAEAKRSLLYKEVLAHEFGHALGLNDLAQGNPPQEVPLMIDGDGIYASSRCQCTAPKSHDLGDYTRRWGPPNSLSRSGASPGCLVTSISTNYGVPVELAIVETC